MFILIKKMHAVYAQKIKKSEIFAVLIDTS